MNCKKLVLGALAAMLSAPGMAQVILNGSLIDWYYWGRPYTGDSSSDTWSQQPTGLGTEENPFNYGLISIGADPNATDGKPVWVADFPIRNHLLYGNCGGVYTGDAYYSFFGHEVNWETNVEGEYGTSEEYEIVVRKWDLAAKTYVAQGTLPYQPTDLAYDPVYDRIYGVFYIGDGYKVGELSYDGSKWNVRTISREAMGIASELRCLAVNSKSELYGIDASGNLYKVSKEDGALSFIGNTGVTSQRRMMSATFDLRTDKLYWIGYMNNGKLSAATDGTNNTLSVNDGGRDTGVYEVNTSTGAATLIGKTDFVDVVMEYDSNGQLTGAKTNKYGKMQITGLYVDGCFTKKNIDEKIELVSLPSQVKAGEKIQAKVLIKNIGLNQIQAKDCVVNFYLNGTKVGTVDRDDETTPIDRQPAGYSQTLTFSFDAPATSGKAEFYAEVVATGDEEARNNKTAVQEIIVLSSEVLPTPELTGENRMGDVKLTWSDPKGHVTDGAEAYAAFSYDGLGMWTMYDGDKAATQKPSNAFNSVNYPNANTPKAFIVFDPEKAGINTTTSEAMFVPYAGKQYFAAFFSAVKDNSEAGGHQVANDDYMISPELSGEAQTISWWAKGYKGSEATGYATEASYPETMNVLYTTGDGVDPTTYQEALAEFTVSNDAWTKYTAELPAGAKHFALHCTSKEGFVLMIDDISFNVAPKTVTGYKVYKNGQLVTTLEADKTSYTVKGAANSDVFTVTALYAEGESEASNAYSISGATSGIAAPKMMQEGLTRVYDLNGRAVSGQLRPGIYLIQKDGKTSKVVIK